MNKNYSASQVASFVNGKVIGDDSIVISDICALNDLHDKSIAFTSVSTNHALEQIIQNQAPYALFIKEGLTPPESSKTVCIAVRNPQRALISLIPKFREKPVRPVGISPKADVAASAKIGKNVFIGAFAVIGEDCEIGDDVTIHPHVVLYQGAKIGARTIIHSGAVVREFCCLGEDVIIQNGAVIGGDGFGYVPNPDGSLFAVPQIGTAQLGNKVEVGVNSCVDRAALGITKIGEGTKLDNQVQIGHNTIIGKHSIVCGQGGLAGSCEIGDHVILGARIGVADHVKVASGSRFTAATNIMFTVEERGDYAGTPAMPVMHYRRLLGIQKQLPEVFPKLRSLMKEQNENN